MKGKPKMKIQEPPIKVTAKLLSFLYECIKRKKVCSEKEVYDYANLTKSYVAKAIDFLVQNNLIEKVDEKFIIPTQIFNKLDGSLDKSLERIKEVLVDKKQFVEYCYFISKGKTKIESAKLIKVIYDVGQTENKIIQIFEDWVKFLNINIKQKPIKNKTLENIEKSINNKLLVNKFIKKEFGDYYNTISKDVLEDLSRSITNIRKEGSQSLNDAGRALEDFLRIDLAKDIDLSKCSGLGQIANELNRCDKFPTKLNNIVLGLGNIRSMGKAHGVDLKIKKRWNISEASVVSYIILIILVIKSYLEYKNHKKLIF
jgi:hypothetical protein